MNATDTTRAQTSEIPIACNLTGADQQLREAAVKGLFGGCERVEELADGYAFIFPGDDRWAADLFKFVLEERKCCPFFTFDLVFEPQGNAIRLQLRGDDNVKLFTGEGFVEGLLGLDPRTVPHS
jgi:hypothetical protein